MIQKLIEEYNVIMICKFGSQLYGTATPESDTDYKGIFLPTKEQILLQKIPKSIKADTKDKHSSEKNTKNDVDIELYSLSYFIELCLKGETVGIDMLHCPNEKIVYKNTDIWEYIRQNRRTFYTNNLKGFVGYCRKQASKYGIKGSRLASARKVSDFLKSFLDSTSIKKMDDVWDILPTGEHIHFIKGGKKNSDEIFYQVCGKKLQKTSTIEYCQGIMEKFINSYGHRAQLAEKNKGIDWKAMSHALRYGYQIKELFQNSDIKFPLRQRKYLTKVKKGLIYYKKVAMCLEGLMDTIERLSKEVSLPNKPNRKFWEVKLLEFYENIIKGENYGKRI